MLHQIRRKGSSASESRGVVARLLECHERIRRMTELATRIAEGGAAAEVADAAARLLQYFETALPRHSADEEQSLAPRLAERVRLAAPVAEMIEQHVAIDRELEQLMPLWRQLVDDPARAPALASELGPPATRLHELFAVHLELEETVIFPAVDQLPPAVHQQILDEMVRRRA